MGAAVKRHGCDGVGAAAGLARALVALAALLCAMTVWTAAARAQHPFEVGAKGRADYTMLRGRLPITPPPIDSVGLYLTFRITQAICAQVEAGNRDLPALAPEGFSVVRGDVHALGFEGRVWTRHFWAMSVTGDSEEDAAAGHPYWEVRYGGDGTPVECGLVFEAKGATVDEATRRDAAVWLFLATPQIFGAIIREPRLFSLRAIGPGDVIHFAWSCRRGWCPGSVLYAFTDEDWRVSVTLRFARATRSHDSVEPWQPWLQMRAR